MKLDKLKGPLPKSKLARIILRSHPRRVVTIVVHGKKGDGKSMFAIKTMWEVYEALGYNEEEAYQKAFNNLIFRPDVFSKRLDEIGKEAEKRAFDAVEPCLCMDDAGVGLGGGLYKLDQQSYWELRADWNTLRTHVTGMFLTTPFPQEVSEHFRGWDFRVKIRRYLEKGEEYGAKAYIYPEESDVLGLHSIASGKKAWNNVFSTFIPDKYYIPYHKRRVKFRNEYKKFIAKAITRRKRKKKEWKEELEERESEREKRTEERKKKGRGEEKVKKERKIKSIGW